MKSSLSLSAHVGIVTIAFTALSALVAGPFANPSVLGFGALVVWGIIQIGRIEYVPAAARRPRPAAAAASIARPAPAPAEYPSLDDYRRAA